MEIVDALGELEILWVDPVAVVARIWELRDDVADFDAAYVAAAELLEMCPRHRRSSAGGGHRSSLPDQAERLMDAHQR